MKSLVSLPTPHHMPLCMLFKCFLCNGTGHKIQSPSFPDSYPPLASAVAPALFSSLPIAIAFFFFYLETWKCFPVKPVAVLLL